MGKGFSKYLTHLWRSVLFWAMAMFLLGVFRYYGIDNGRIDSSFSNTSRNKPILSIIFGQIPEQNVKKQQV